MTLELLIESITNPENQPHEFVGKFTELNNILSLLIIKLVEHKVELKLAIKNEMNKNEEKPNEQRKEVNF